MKSMYSILHVYDPFMIHLHNLFSHSTIFLLHRVTTHYLTSHRPTNLPIDPFDPLLLVFFF